MNQGRDIKGAAYWINHCMMTYMRHHISCTAQAQQLSFRGRVYETDQVILANFSCRVTNWCTFVAFFFFYFRRYYYIQTLYSSSSVQFSLFTATRLAYRQLYIMSATLAAITQPKPTHGRTKSQSQLPFFTWLLSRAVAYRPDSVTQVCRMASVLSASVCVCLSLSLSHSNTGITSAIQKIGID